MNTKNREDQEVELRQILVKKLPQYNDYTSFNEIINNKINNIITGLTESIDY